MAWNHPGIESARHIERSSAEPSKLEEIAARAHRRGFDAARVALALGADAATVDVVAQRYRARNEPSDVVEPKPERE